MTYYNCIDRKDFEKLSKEQQNDFLVGKKLFQYYYEFPISLNLKNGEQVIRKKITDIEKRLKPVPELKHHFYDFVLQRYQNEIQSPFFLFFKEFNEDIYGLSFEEQKKIALFYSNLYYNKIKNEVYSGHIRLLSPTGVEHIKNESRFKALFQQRIASKDNLANNDFLLEFLFGNADFFDTELLKKTDVLQKTIEFESTLKILISLNDTYHFERDFYFSELGMLQEKYQTIYKKSFVSFDAFLFTHEKINSFEQHKQANIESLHATLKTLELIRGKNNTFINYVENEHGVKMLKIRKYETYKNRTHDDRVRIFKQDWQQFSAEK